jgi:hypothetical protein
MQPQMRRVPRVIRGVGPLPPETETRLINNTLLSLLTNNIQNTVVLHEKAHSLTSSGYSSTITRVRASEQELHLP